MPGLNVVINGPAPNTTVGRSLQITGSAVLSNPKIGEGTLDSVEIQFGAGGPTVTAGIPDRGFGWTWDGLVPNAIRPGQAFEIIVRADGSQWILRHTENVEVTGTASAIVVLENVVPILSVDLMQSPIVVTQVPYPLPLGGTVSEGNGPPYAPQVQYQIGDGPFTDATISQGAWSAAPALEPGDYLISIWALDAFGSVTPVVQRAVTILFFAMPAVVDPNAKKTLTGVPTTSSITSWTRLEPQCANADIGNSSNARLFDPLWLMTRQWQMGEFQAEDTGSPVQARVRATNALLTRCYFGELPANSAAASYDPARAPLETMTERRRMRATDPNDARMLALAVEAGLHFLRMLELSAATKKYRPAFLARYTLQPLPANSVANADDATLRFVATMAGRAPDARLLAAAFRAAGTSPIVFDPALKIAPADVGALQHTATAWLSWYDGLFAEPAAPADDAWTPARLEYAVSVSTRLSAQPLDGVTFSASEFDGGRLDWSSFDVNTTFNLDTIGDAPFVALNETTVPAPVTVRGTPAPRFWEVEDAKLAYGLLPAGPTDLAHLLLIEYASTYGNDWYVVPLSVPVGTVTRVDSLIVTDTFGVRNLLRPIGDPALANPYFSMWQQARRRYAGDPIGAPISNLFFLPPTIGRSIDGAPLEDVLFMRDEMANLAWGIERSIEGATQNPVILANGSTAPDTADAADAGALPRYLLSSTVPANWIPLLPVQLDDQGSVRLKRGAVLQPDGSAIVRHARSEALNAAAGLLFYDEEIPREGVHVTRRRRMTRWIDGSTWVWTAFRNEVGSGEGSAGLRFDQLLGNGPPP